MDYKEFLKTKEIKTNESGFDINLSELNSNLFDFQAHIVQKALKNGKYAIFADCGLGKTLMQLSFADAVVKRENCKSLIIAPLAVVEQTIREGAKFGIEVSVLDRQNKNGVYITNYEQLKNIDCSQFDCVVLDESSILKNFTGKMKNLIIDSFANTRYKLACTATPSPNDPMEIGNHSEFLNVMTRNEMLAMYFVHDGGNTSKWRLKGHAKKHFYSWMQSWSVMLTKPSDIGFNDNAGYVLPELNMIEKQIKTDKKDNGQLFNDKVVSATNFNKELRLTIIERFEEVAKIVNNSNEQFIIWIKQDEEGKIARKLIPDAVEVKGSDKPDYKKEKLSGFAENKFRVLVTKLKIAQFGLNYQNCHNQVFASLDFSFEGLYQGIRRSYRFGQKENVNIYLITTDTMQNVVQSINKKQKQFLEMQNEMCKAHNEDFEKYYEGVQNYVKNDFFELKKGDSMQLIHDVEPESVGLTIFSIPFLDLYTFSNKKEDLSNCKDYEKFKQQFEYLLEGLYKAMMQGRNVAVHLMDTPIQKGKEGYIGLRDFSGMILQAFQKAGFIYHSRVTIWKDPVIEMVRTKALGLLYKQCLKDMTMNRVGIPDYVMIFRKDGERNNPVRHFSKTKEAQDFCMKKGIDKDLAKHYVLGVDEWEKIASPVWNDINYSNTLQSKNARDNDDEKHISLLQLDTIERLIRMYSNAGDTILDPFNGIGSTTYQAVKMGRKGLGFELKDSYFDCSVRNCNNAVQETNQQSLF